MFMHYIYMYTNFPCIYMLPFTDSQGRPEKTLRHFNVWKPVSEANARAYLRIMGVGPHPYYKLNIKYKCFTFIKLGAYLVERRLESDELIKHTKLRKIHKDIRLVDFNRLYEN